MQTIVNFIFDNIFLFLFLGFGVIVYLNYRSMKEYTNKINDIFTKTLNTYLDKKIKEARDTTDAILKEYGREDEISTEITRLLGVIEKVDDGGINNKVTASNAVNKFKLSKKVDLEKYPNMSKLNNLKTFTDEEINSLDNGLAIARREYNTLAFRYNEKTSGLLQQYIAKLFKLNLSYVIFDALESQRYAQTYEVFEEEAPQVDNLAMLNLGGPYKENINDIKNNATDKTSKNDIANDIVKPSFVVDKYKNTDEEEITEDTR